MSSVVKSHKCNISIFIFSPSLSVYLQTGEYATDEEEEMSPVFPNSIEVFDLAENQDMLSPVELDPEKLAHKFKEVYVILIIWVPNRILFLCVVFGTVPCCCHALSISLCLQLQIKHAVTQAEIQLLKRKVRPVHFQSLLDTHK